MIHDAVFYEVEVVIGPVSEVALFKATENVLGRVRRCGVDPDEFVDLLRRCLITESDRFLTDFVLHALWYSGRSDMRPLISLDAHASPRRFRTLSPPTCSGRMRREDGIRATIVSALEDQYFRGQNWPAFGPDVSQGFLGIPIRVAADFRSSLDRLVSDSLLAKREIRPVETSWEEMIDRCLAVEPEILTADTQGIVQILPSELLVANAPHDIRRKLRRRAGILADDEGDLPKVLTRQPFRDPRPDGSKRYFLPDRRERILQFAAAADRLIAKHALDDISALSDPDLFDVSELPAIRRRLGEFEAVLDLLGGKTVSMEFCDEIAVLREKTEIIRRAEAVASRL